MERYIDVYVLFNRERQIVAVEMSRRAMVLRQTGGFVSERSAKWKRSLKAGYYIERMALCAYPGKLPF